MISGNIWYHLTWQLMIDIIMRIPFLPVQNKYPSTRFICQSFDNKRHIDNQKVQVADEIKCDIWKHLRRHLMLDKIMCKTFLSEQNNTQLLVLYARIFWGKRHVDNQKVQVTDKIKRYACMHYIIIYYFHVTGY